MRYLIYTIFVIVLSPFISIGQTHYLVTSTADDVNPVTPNTLRWAIDQANNNPELDYIDFQIAGVAPHSIQLSASLPIITSPIIINGNTQPANGYTGNFKRIEIKGLITQSFASVFWLNGVRSSASQILNLKLSNSQNHLILVQNSNNNTINYCVLNNANLGIHLGNSSTNIIKGNYFGTDENLTANPLLELASGRGVHFVISDAPNNNNNTVGGILTNEGNYFYKSIIALQSGYGNTFSGNLFVSTLNPIISLGGFVGVAANDNIIPPNITEALHYSNGTTVIKGNTNRYNSSIELYKTPNENSGAPIFLGTVQANETGNWTFNTTLLNITDHIRATVTDINKNTSNFTLGINVTQGIDTCCNSIGLAIKDKPTPYIVCPNESLTFLGSFCNTLSFAPSSTSNASSNVIITWNFGDGTPVVSNGFVNSQNITHTYTTDGTYTVTVTVSDPTGACAPSTKTMQVVVSSANCVKPKCATGGTINIPRYGCTNQPINLDAFFNSVTNTNLQFSWQLGNGTTTPLSNTAQTTAIYTQAAYYPLIVISSSSDNSCTPETLTVAAFEVRNCDNTACQNCIESFAPIPGKTYVISAWVKHDNTSTVVATTYANPVIKVITNASPIPVIVAVAKGDIIDGWQRIEESFTIPATATTLDLQLKCGTDINANCLFDDVRVFPTDGSMQSYVYDPLTLKLVAQLDERNYATFYEYDTEGKLIRLKKETERGIMTIKETRESTIKK